jgi:anti-anti-sigma factor
MNIIEKSSIGREIWRLPRHNLVVRGLELTVTQSVGTDVEFSITAHAQADGSTLVALAGEFDLAGIPALTTALRTATGPIVVDLQDVSFLDSATLAVLVQEHRRLQSAARRLVVVVGEHTPTTVFETTGIDRILTIRPAGGWAPAERRAPT